MILYKGKDCVYIKVRAGVVTKVPSSFKNLPQFVIDFMDGINLKAGVAAKIFFDY
jgi:hypothetical protein